MVRSCTSRSTFRHSARGGSSPPTRRFEEERTTDSEGASSVSSKDTSYFAGACHASES